MSSEYHIELSILVSLPSWPVAALHEKYLWGDHDIQPNQIGKFLIILNSYTVELGSIQIVY